MLHARSFHKGVRRLTFQALLRHTDHTALGLMKSLPSLSESDFFLGVASAESVADILTSDVKHQ